MTYSAIFVACVTDTESMNLNFYNLLIFCLFQQKYALLEERDWAHISATQRPSLIHNESGQSSPNGRVDMNVGTNTFVKLSPFNLL